MKKYVWLSKDGTFSESWNEETHKSAFSDEIDGGKIISYASNNGARLIQFEVVAGEDFDFPYNTILIKKPKP